ncbi:hypothetical protein [Methylobacterium sp. DB0501]|uniref:head-tail joining protein n=2 Tax=Methylobacterium TaxID=407 RepID=UPI001FEF292F|nr:hypothetical protein [Methylobacterium sp. DB0501]
MAVDALFEDPNLSCDAVWRANGAGDGLPVRIRRRSPEGIVGAGGGQFDLDAMLIDVRLSEVPSPAKGDTFEVGVEDGEPGGLFEVIGLATIDSHRLVRTCEVAAIAEDDPEDEEP